MQDKADIHRPACAWRPGHEDRWACGEVSAHEAWYHYPVGRERDTADTAEAADGRPSAS
jgi:hypothetical protein